MDAVIPPKMVAVDATDDPLVTARAARDADAERQFLAKWFYRLESLFRNE